MLPFPDLTGLKRYQPKKLKRANSDGEVKGYTFAYKKKYTGWLDALQNTRKKNMKLETARMLKEIKYEDLTLEADWLEEPVKMPDVSEKFET